MATKQFTVDHAGCFYDSARGYYIGEEVISLAIEMGMTVKPEDVPHTLADGELYYEMWDEAEQYLQQFAPDGFFFGSTENGDWGLWPIEGYDEIEGD